MNPSAGFLRWDDFAGFVGLFAGLFTLLTAAYSVEHMAKRTERELFRYYTCIGATFLTALGAIFANNLIVFMVFWGFLGMLLFLLIGFGRKERTSYTAKKALIIVGGTDAVMLLGVALVWYLAGKPKFTELNMDTLHVPLTSNVAVVAYLCLLVGALAKAGAMPFHTWVPDTAEDAPAPVTAFLPASLDKLLGIYLVARLSLEVFDMSKSPGMHTFLMALGSFTIIAAVMMALVQHDLKRLLGYHAVSQVGYMVLGIGTGVPLGIAGGLFHMLNHAIYKACLFFSAGNVEKQTGTTDLDKLGGLSKRMPITCIAFFAAALAISGVPPFNGFASKWMVYQGIIDVGRDGGSLWVVWLVAAMFGSALTLASFMKLAHAVFLGQPAKDSRPVCEVGPYMWVPTIILAGLCILFGVFAFAIPLKFFILPSLHFGTLTIWGSWQPAVAAALLLIGLAVGVVIYFLGRAGDARTVQPFVGGEILDEHPEMRMSGVDFYRTIQDMSGLRTLYELAERKAFDSFEVVKQVAMGLHGGLSFLHNGLLSRYISWCVLGMLIILLILMG